MYSTKGSSLVTGHVPTHPFPDTCPDPNPTLTQTLDLTQRRGGTWPATKQGPKLLKIMSFEYFPLSVVVCVACRPTKVSLQHVLSTTYLNLGLSVVMIPTSSSEGLKSADSTDDKQLMAVCREKKQSRSVR